MEKGLIIFFFRIVKIEIAMEVSGGNECIKSKTTGSNLIQMYGLHGSLRILPPMHVFHCQTTNASSLDVRQ